MSIFFSLNVNSFNFVRQKEEDMGKHFIETGHETYVDQFGNPQVRDYRKVIEIDVQEDSSGMSGGCMTYVGMLH